MTIDALDRFWAVVPAGGAGTRLWPLSRAGAPKFLLDLNGSGRTLLQQTIDRLAPLVDGRALVVTGARHRDAVCAQLDLPDDQVVGEPSPRDSMAAIGLAAAMLERDDPDAILGSFAADHVITDEDVFRACITEAVAVADTGVIVTLGIQPTSPSTAFGYLELGEPVGGFATARAVRSFTEKPDAATAAEYLATGDYRWNGGMFVTRAAVLLDELARDHPDLAAGLRAIAADPAEIDERWPALTKIAIDHAVAEPAAARGMVATVPGSFGWDDIGDFASLGALLPGDGVKVLGDRDRVLALDSTGLVATAGRTVAVVGLDDVVVVDTGDALLVTDRAHAQQVKAVVDALKQRGADDLV
jgi:mannose-1-phosphate guanylyltransferase